MPHPERIYLVAYSLEPKAQREYKSALLQFIKYCKGKNMKAYEIAYFDNVLCECTLHYFEQPARYVWVTSTKLCLFYNYT